MTQFLYKTCTKYILKFVSKPCRLQNHTLRNFMLNSLQKHIHKIYVVLCVVVETRVLVSLGYSSFQIELHTYKPYETLYGYS